MSLNRARMESAFETALDHLTSQMKPEGYWEGELSPSALSTATAISALSVAGLDDKTAIGLGQEWLRRSMNPDGGWGDTIDSPSNLATTLLVTTAMKLSGAEVPQATQAYLANRAGRTETELVAAIGKIYGNDRTFAVPILANCALAGMVSWNSIPALPFELAIFPRSLYRLLKLHVVSYALPALIAIGLAIHHKAPSRSPLRRMVRNMVTDNVLKKLGEILPESGGFLEATPLTSFVAMSLASVLGADNAVVEKCLAFLRRSQREDGSWSIDSNLSVWVTTGAISTLGRAGRLEDVDCSAIGNWLVARQYKSVHPFTGAAPGGFGWTHLPGGVPDADDTSGAVLACLALGRSETARAAVDWLLDLQNSDGGWPAFCRGWGQLAFDRSSPDITAHAIRALRASDPDQRSSRCHQSIERGFAYLASTQQPDGSWIPLWFGNQAAADQSNRTLGTARSLLAYMDCNRKGENATRGVKYLLEVQNADGGWGGGAGIASSMEETALAVTALIRFDCDAEVERGLAYLVSRVEDSTWTIPAPIGLYFSSLWYSEKLYPVIWTVEALGLAMQEQKEQVSRSDSYVRSA